jgi:hypothetical protein
MKRTSPLKARRALFLCLFLLPSILTSAQNRRNGKKAAPDATAATTTTSPTQSTATSVPATSSIASSAVAPVAKNMKEFKSTPQGQARARKYNKNFGDAHGSAEKDVKYSDGTSVHLKMIKNPDFGGQGTGIKARINGEKGDKSKKDEKPETSTDSKGVTWSCTTDHVQLTATSTTFMNNDYSSSASHIYPGAIYTFDDFYNGSYKEEEGERNPLTILTDNTNVKGKGYISVPNPNMATIRAAIDQLFRETSGPVATESLSTQMYQTANDADQSLMISGGASGYGVSLSAGYKTSSQSSSYNLTIDAVKTLFSINTIPPDNGYFKDEKVESTPNLMVLGSVSYGVRVLANMTVTFNSQQEEADFRASYSGWGISANVDLDQLSKEKSVSETINCYVVGGPGNSTISFNKRELKAQIQKLLAGATYKNAMPIKYEFYDMAGDVIGSNSATDNFAVRNCVPGKDNPKLESAYVTFNTGDDDKNQNDDFTLMLFLGNVKQTPSPTGYVDFERAPVFDYGSGPNSPQFPNQSNQTIQLLPVNKDVTMQDFMNNGGMLNLSMYPHGSDTWKITSIQLTLNFEGSANKPQQITFGGITPVGDGNVSETFYFGGNFKQR